MYILFCNRRNTLRPNLDVMTTPARRRHKVLLYTAVILNLHPLPPAFFKQVIT